MTDLYFYEDRESGDIEALLDCLPLSFSLRIRKHRDFRTKRASFFAYALLYADLRRRCHENRSFSDEKAKECDLFVLSENENGKPYLTNLPYYFSLSHSRNLSVCAVSDVSCGVDIEEVLTNPDTDIFNKSKQNCKNLPLNTSKKQVNLVSIARRFLSREEVDDIACSTSVPLAFAKSWTAHEAFAKASGTTLYSTFQKPCRAPFYTLITVSDGKKYALSCIGKAPFCLQKGILSDFGCN